MPTEFEFTDLSDIVLGHDSFVLNVPGGITSKADLLAAFERAGHFPAYFGRNWDALLDCLRDFSWIRNQAVVVMHRDLPLRGSPDDGRRYLEILGEALADWSREAKAGAMEPPSGWPFVDHEFRVVFPIEVSCGATKGHGPCSLKANHAFR